MNADRLPEPPAVTPAAAEEQMLQLVYVVRDALMRRHAFGEIEATEWACTIVAALREEYGGEKIYIRAEEKCWRNERIRAESRPGNAAELAQRYGLSESRVYQIVGRRSR